MEQISLWSKIQNYLPFSHNNLAPHLSRLIFVISIFMFFLGVTHTYKDANLNDMLMFIGGFFVFMLLFCVPFLIPLESLSSEAMTDISRFNWCVEASTELKKRILTKKTLNFRDLNIICNLQHEYVSQIKQQEQEDSLKKAKEKILQT